MTAISKTSPRAVWALKYHAYAKLVLPRFKVQGECGEEVDRDDCGTFKLKHSVQTWQEPTKVRGRIF